MKKIIFTLFIAALFNPLPSHAKFFYLGTGATLLNMGKITSSDNASTSLMGELYFPVTLQLPIRISNRLSIIPNASYTPFAVKKADEVTKKIFTAGLNAAIQTNSVFQIKTGLGYLAYSISGPGGTVERSNGAGTATYALPGTQITTKSFFVDIGCGFRLGQSFRLDLDGFILGALTTRRSFTTMVSLSAGVF